MAVSASEGARPRAEVLSGEAHGLPWGSNTRPLSPLVVILQKGVVEGFKPASDLYDKDMKVK